MDNYRKKFLRRQESANDIRRLKIQEQKNANEWKEREKELKLYERYIPMPTNVEEDVYYYPPERLSPNRQLSNEILKKEEKTKELLKRANKVKEYMPNDVKTKKGEINPSNASNPFFKSYVTQAENLKRGGDTPSPTNLGIGGKRKTNKRKLNKKKQTKKRKTLKKNKKSKKSRRN